MEQENFDKTLFWDQEVFNRVTKRGVFSNYPQQKLESFAGAGAQNIRLKLIRNQAQIQNILISCIVVGLEDSRKYIPKKFPYTHDVLKCNFMSKAAEIYLNAMDKTTDHYVKAMHCYRYSFQLRLPSWRSNGIQFVKMTLFPEYYGFNQQFASQKSADRGLQELKKLTGADRDWNINGWLLFLYQFSAKRQISVEAREWTRRCLDYSLKYQQFPQYEGFIYFMNGYFYHYYEHQFEKAKQFYEKSILMRDNNGWARCIDSGKYAAYFHLRQLLEYPQDQGFPPQKSNLIKVQQLRQISRRLIETKQSSAEAQIKRYIGYHSKEEHWENNYLCPFTKRNQNYVEAMRICNIALALDQQNVNLIYIKAWLYQYKSVLFENTGEREAALVHLATKLKEIAMKADNLNSIHLLFLLKIVFDKNQVNSIKQVEKIIHEIEKETTDKNVKKLIDNEKKSFFEK